MESKEPVVLELAPLPREQLGPFLLLGIDKDADVDQIEAHWAQRVIWARKNLIRIPLQDINWAREVVNDLDRRVRADVGSLNTDTLGGALRELASHYGMDDPARPIWVPIDVEKPLSDYTPPAEAPDVNELRRSIAVPELPWEAPAAAPLLEEFALQPLDPWQIQLPEE